MIPSYGKRPKFMFITDAPSYSECVSRKFAEGKSFNYTLSSLKEAELKKSDGYYTALVKTKKADKQLSTEEINTWSSFIDAEIELLKPPVIIAAGGAIARHLCPDVKGGWEAIAGTSVYDVKRDCTIIFSPNPQMVYAKPDVQTVLDNIMCDVAEMLR
ncbi:uracil-DNA glycosylase family protein [Aeromonas hydrophila]